MTTSHPPNRNSLKRKTIASQNPNGTNQEVDKNFQRNNSLRTISSSKYSSQKMSINNIKNCGLAEKTHQGFSAFKDFELHSKKQTEHLKKEQKQLNSQIG